MCSMDVNVYVSNLEKVHLLFLKENFKVKISTVNVIFWKVMYLVYKQMLLNVKILKPQQLYTSTKTSEEMV